MENSDEFHEKQRLKMRIAVLEESMKSCELESKAGRETVLRLEAELDQERRKAARSNAALESLKLELDGLTMGRRSVEAENQAWSERLEASRRVIEAARRESCCLEKQVEEFQKKSHASEGKLQVFLEKLATVLKGRPEDVIPPTETDVLNKVDNICNKVVSAMETRLCRVSEELKVQTELQRSTLQRAQLAEQQVQDLRERLHRVETELLTADKLIDEQGHNKQHYEEFLEQLSEAMKLENIAVDLGVDMRLNLILSRAEQLVKQEAAALMESKSLAYSLQRKVKSQKDQLDSKGLHIQILRKKVSQLDEENRTRSAVEREDACAEARRLQKKLVHLQGELKATKLTNSELKAQLSHNNELKVEGRRVLIQKESRRIFTA
ncbi:coiled-coil domain-containing protein 170 isoform 1-T1 [Menidia menidia]